MRRALTLLSVLAFAIALAGCGGGGGGNGNGDGPNGTPLTKSEYEAKIQQIVKDVGEQFADVDIQENTDEALDLAVDALRKVAEELDGVSPPEEIADLHRDLVDGIREFADELPGFADKLESTKDPGEAIAILFGSKSIQKLAKVQEELKKAGISISLQTETTETTETTP